MVGGRASPPPLLLPLLQKYRQYQALSTLAYSRTLGNVRRMVVFTTDMMAKHGIMNMFYGIMSMFYAVHQGYVDLGDRPHFSLDFEPLARMTLYLSGAKTLSSEILGG